MNQLTDSNSSQHAIFRHIQELTTNVNQFEVRISALEAKKNNDSSDLKRALMDADNAIQKAIAFLRRTDAENRNSK